jgi:hypothetical protein
MNSTSMIFEFDDFDKFRQNVGNLLTLLPCQRGRKKWGWREVCARALCAQSKSCRYCSVELSGAQG